MHTTLKLPGRENLFFAKHNFTSHFTKTPDPFILAMHAEYIVSDTQF